MSGPVIILGGDTANAATSANAIPTQAAIGVTTISLAQNKSTATTTANSPSLPAGSYLWDVQATSFGGATASLDVLSSDGVTFRSLATRTTSGTTGVVLGANSVVRISFTGGTPTGLYSTLS